MLAFSPHHFEELKNCVLAAAEIKSITPADCKLIAFLINNKTKQNISETTLKRIYGFAYSKFRPSLFTIDVLAKFCDYDGWENFCERQGTPFDNIPEKDLNWQLLKQNANKITGFTLQALKNKSGIPYNQTIKREFIDYHFIEFLKSGRTGTVLSAPAGYGKTIALCHWIDEKIALNAANDVNDIILLFSSNALMNVLHSGRDVNAWMLALLGYSADNDINALLDIKQRKGGKFYLIVDGFDEHMFKNDQFRMILNQLIDIFSFYQSHEWFKVVLTTRISTWVNNRHEMEVGNNTWFTGIKADNDHINIPLFSLQEIRDLCHQINPAIQNNIPIDVAENFNHPLYFQFYYKQHRDNFSLNNVDYLSIYGLISTFILNKVYLGHYSAEKILLIKKLVESLDIKNNNFYINKLKANSLIKQYSHAYQELLSVGFLRELNESNDHHYNAYIKFGNSNFLEHSIAKVLLYNNGNLFDNDLIKSINGLLSNSPRKVEVLKWCVMHAIKSGQLRNIEHLTEARVNSSEKLELIIFLAEVLEREYTSNENNEALMTYFKHPFSEKIFDYFLGLELINPHYIRTLNILLKFELSDKKKILIYTTLTMIAAAQLNLNGVEAGLVKLKAFPKAEYDSFIINPLNCLDALYYHLKYGIIKTQVLADLTKLSFSKIDKPASLNRCAVNELLYILSLYTLLLCDNHKKSLRFINFLNKNYKNTLAENNTSQYGFFIAVMIANAYHGLGDNARVTEIYNTISAVYKKSEEQLTPYMKILFHATRIKTQINTPKENLIIGDMKSINHIADMSGYKFAKLYTSIVILKSVSLQTNVPEFYKQVKYDFMKMMRENGLSSKPFLHQSMIMDE